MNKGLTNNQLDVIIIIESEREVNKIKLGNCGNALAKGHSHQGGIALRPSVL